MANWCNYYNCWCDDVEEIIPEEGIECELDCKHCKNVEKIEPNT